MVSSCNPHEGLGFNFLTYSELSDRGALLASSSFQSEAGIRMNIKVDNHGCQKKYHILNFEI